MLDRTRARGLAAALFVGCLLAAGCERDREAPTAAAPAAPRCGPDLLLVSIDTLRADHVSLYGYERPTTPRIDRWFADAARYEHAYSTASATPPSVVGFLSGLLPQQHRVQLFYQLLPDDVRILPDLLPDCYQSAAFVSNMVLTDEAIGMASRFDHYDDYVTELGPRRVYERRAAPTTDAALAWLRSERDPGRALFLWVHYFDPHGPYGPPAHWERTFHHEGRRELVLSKMPPYQLQPGVDDALEYVDLYDEEIRYTDAEVGRLLEGYGALHPLDEALVVLTADHGEAMHEPTFEVWFEHGFHVWEPLVRVPLLVRGPQVSGGPRQELVSTADIVSTLLTAAGAPVPDGIERIDLRTGAGTSPERPVFVSASLQRPEWRSVLSGRHKWVASVGANARILKRRFYDLEADPDELAPQPWPEDAAPAVARLEALIQQDPNPGGLPSDQERQGLALQAPKVDPRAGPEELERLRALGYVQ